MSDDNTVGRTSVDPQSKQVMTRGESGDTISVETLGDCTIVRRDRTYFGPKLRIENEGEQFLLTAPGPKSGLMLWRLNRDELNWVEHAEVTAGLVDTKQYDICGCGEPLKTPEHETKALLNVGEHA